MRIFQRITGLKDTKIQDGKVGSILLMPGGQLGLVAVMMGAGPQNNMASLLLHHLVSTDRNARLLPH